MLERDRPFFVFVFVFGVFLGHFRFAVRFNPVFEISLAYIFSTFPATKSPQLISIPVYALPSCIGLQAVVPPRYTRGWRHPWQSIILDSYLLILLFWHLALIPMVQISGRFCGVEDHRSCRLCILPPEPRAFNKVSSQVRGTHLTDFNGFPCMSSTSEEPWSLHTTRFKIEIKMKQASWLSPHEVAH